MVDIRCIDVASMLNRWRDAPINDKRVVTISALLAPLPLNVLAMNVLAANVLLANVLKLMTRSHSCGFHWNRL